MARFTVRSTAIVTGLVAALVIGPALISAKPLPSDRCALLPSSELQSVLSGSFGKPVTTTAPSPYAGIPVGTDCTYTAGQTTVLFRIYQDPSAATAKETFAKLSMFYPARTKPPHLGDSAYIDTSNAIHVLKGRVRFYINVTPTAKDEQLVNLATFVAGQL